MDTITLTDHHFLHILQLASSALPVGAYSYSEGLETLVESGTITSQSTLQQWLEAELSYGAIRLEAAVMVRSYQATIMGEMETLRYWNLWLSAARETQELRNSSWQMGRSLMQLLGKIQPEILSLANSVGNPCNYAIAFAIASAHWQVNIQAALLAYLHSWATNLITAGVKLIPLGQTAGQELLLQLQPLISHATVEIMSLKDDELSCCSWGLSLASMQHETQYTRLFRS
ncbi:Urease accessory protein UreF [Trichormus variabilis ATCC 29413]|uniref:Urease accessory protein UreF n=2 Tax=Anabaena variabilis TaxID=264691 RepID=UREF_TRIV2|nr:MULTISPECIES: urease accessory protein UreF [Nostocaceae]Q3M454.1 RecName: Full=Urease accessory protein UreF [Trichormus variabilis ATCC 29413]ABA24232.1 Urease accessory protein UreF [Trichormus variabilis ATCC 29413]MBC1214050.1 urease accessory protein UreF [Trichormus variabilis ARAD]MBC1254600.1 urease accessory protein UreF [Trichormus variabilis V5]MBC1268616.1 urease accessory protein UreF [Trichormus variabilis FSR]MBC1302490.1 urease accessory protein UreF [Trichormus variabilis